MDINDNHNSNGNKPLFESKYKLFTILTIVNSVGILILTGVISFMAIKMTPPEQAKKNHEREFTQGSKVPVDLLALAHNSPVQGNINAPTTIVLFNSFTCGYCSKAVSVIDQLLAKHGQNIKVVYKHFLRNEHDVKAGQAFECANEQGRPWEMYHTIFSSGVVEDYSVYARKVGINIKQFNICMKSDKFQAKMENDLRTGLQLGISGTPAFLVDERLFIGYMPFASFDTIVSQAISEKS